MRSSPAACPRRDRAAQGPVRGSGAPPPHAPWPRARARGRRSTRRTQRDRPRARPTLHHRGCPRPPSPGARWPGPRAPDEPCRWRAREPREPRPRGPSQNSHVRRSIARRPPRLVTTMRGVPLRGTRAATPRTDRAARRRPQQADGTCQPSQGQAGRTSVPSLDETRSVESSQSPPHLGRWSTDPQGQRLVSGSFSPPRQSQHRPEDHRVAAHAATLRRH